MNKLRIACWCVTTAAIAWCFQRYLLGLYGISLWAHPGLLAACAMYGFMWLDAPRLVKRLITGREQ